VLSASNIDNKIAWYENHGLSQGFFNNSAQQVISLLPGAVSIIAADIDNDGDMDVVTAGYTAAAVVWYENQGAANNYFEKSQEQWIGTNMVGATSIVTADIDSDNVMDVVAAAYNGGIVAWYDQK